MKLANWFNGKFLLQITLKLITRSDYIQFPQIFLINQFDFPCNQKLIDDCQAIQP